MKIAYTASVFGPITGGGVGTYTANVTADMARRGHEVYLVSPCFTPENMHYLPHGVTLVPIDLPGQNEKDFYYTHWNRYSEAVYRALLVLSQKVDLDIIEFPEHAGEGFTTIRAKRLLGQFANIPLIEKLHITSKQLVTFQQRKFSNYDYEALYYMEDYTIKYADLVTAPSAAIARLAQEQYGIQPIRSLYPLTIEGNSQPRTFDKKQLDKVVLLGAVNPVKGTDYFVEAAKQILAHQPNFIFEIYGRDTESGPFGLSYTNYLKWRIPPELQDKIVFKGKIPYEQVAKALQSATWCVLPSRWDNWPNACLEAMSAGCVVIGSKNGGMAEMIQDGQSGFVVDPSQPDRIAQIILDHFEDIEYLTRLSRQAQLDVKKWADPDLICQNIEEGYQQALARPARPWRTDITPLVSVVIPLYNQGQFLTEALASVKASTYSNYEIVVVNDGSIDAETNAAFEELGPGIVKINQVRGGIGQARNNGVKAAKGELIVILDAADRLHPQFIEKAVQALINNPELACVTSSVQYFGEADHTHNFIGLVPALALFSNMSGGSLVAIRKEVLLAVGGYDEERTTIEDWDLQLKLYSQGYQSDVLPGHFHLQRQFPPGQPTDKQPESRFLIQYLFQRYPKLLEEHRLPAAQVLTDLWQEARKTIAGREEWIQIQADAISYYRGVEQDQLRRITDLEEQLRQANTPQPEAEANYLYTTKLEKIVAEQQAENAWLHDVLHHSQNGRVMRLLGLLHKINPLAKK